MNLLNLDAIVEATREVTLRGETYTMAQQSLGQLLEAVSLSKMTGDDIDEMKTLKGMLNMAQQILPDCPSEVLETLSLQQLNSLIEFSNAQETELLDGEEAKKSKSEKTKTAA